MKVYFIALFLIQFGSSQPSSAAPEIGVSAEVEARLKACPSMAYAVENSSLNARKAVVTMLDSMMTGLKSSGLNLEEAKHVLNGIKVTMQIAIEKNDPFLLPAVKFINRNEGKPSTANDKLMVCVVSVGCHLNSELFGSSSTNTGYVFGRRTDANTKRDLSIEKEISLDREELLTIVPYRIQPESKSESHLEGIFRVADWYGQFFRDVTQSSTLDLLDRWFRANERVVANGGQPDPFYKRVFSSEAERVELYYVLNFVTSHAAGLAARKSYINEVITTGVESIVAQLEQKTRKTAIKDINSVAGNNAASKFGLNEENVFEMGSMLTQMMEITIRSAP